MPLQLIMEQPLEKKSGVRFGPPGARRLVYFIDDMNMPLVDKYDTQSAIELARQLVDYRGWCADVPAGSCASALTASRQRLLACACCCAVKPGV